MGDRALIPMLLDGENITTCPKRAYCDHFRELDPVLERYTWAQKGHWPEPGLWPDQPAVLIECFRIIDTALHDAEEVKERQRKAAAKAEAAQRAAATSGSAPAPRRTPSHPSVSRRPT